MNALAVLGAAAFLGSQPIEAAPLALPDGDRGIGFDDLLFSPALGKVLVPAGRSGRLDLIDPKTLSVDSIAGFTTGRSFGGGHDEGTTSADAGGGLLFASDRSRKLIAIVDPAKKEIVGSAKLGGGPDYVRWVEPLGEVWVTEPGRKGIEYFKLEAGAKPKLVASGFIPIAGGPESLVVDASRGRAYTHTWASATVAIDLKAHKEVARWPNDCKGSRGIALDAPKGWLFVGCDEGKAVALDITRDGRRLGEATSGKGVDIIAYSPRLSHLYLPGGDSATMAIIAVTPTGELKVLATVPTANDAHCVAADDSGHAYVCDPSKGRLLVVTDPFPASR